MKGSAPRLFGADAVLPVGSGDGSPVRAFDDHRPADKRFPFPVEQFPCTERSWLRLRSPARESRPGGSLFVVVLLLILYVIKVQSLVAENRERAEFCVLIRLINLICMTNVNGFPLNRPTFLRNLKINFFKIVRMIGG